MDSTSRPQKAWSYEDSPLPQMPARFPRTPPSAQSNRLQQRQQQLPQEQRLKSPRRAEITSPSNVNISKNKQTAHHGPVISATILDPAQQRLYAVAAFGLLQAWKVYDLLRLYNEQDDSISELWFILKWLTIDGFFIHWLPLLRIPWLNFTTQVTIIQIIVMGALNIFLSLRYQVSIQLVLVALWKKLYNRELSISEKRVKVNDIVFNSSHILGKHTLHFLPEGSAKINPDNAYYCLDASKTSISVPIRINSTLPSLIQISHQSFDSSEVQLYNITQKEVKKMIKASPRSTDPKIHHIQYTVKTPGLYRLSKVVDVSNLVVRIYRSEALIVECPTAIFNTAGASDPVSNKCKGDLSNMELEVKGLPPLHVKYSRTINHDERGVTIESVTPEHYDSPLIRKSAPGDKLVLHGKAVDLQWAQTQTVKISLNESLATGGNWMYSIEEVRDGLGNVVHFNHEHEHNNNKLIKAEQLRRQFTVYNRPEAKFKSCSPQHPLRVARGSPVVLPIEITGDDKSPPYELTYAFTPFDSMKSSTEHADEPERRELTIKSIMNQPITRDPGLYTLKTVSSQYCTGEVLESSTCLVITPPDPSLSIAVDEILDKCAGFSIGLTVDLTLVGTPPFKVWYRMVKDKKEISIRQIEVKGTRHQIQLTPAAAGHYSYEFFSLTDNVYKDVSLNTKELRAEQRVIPPAGAYFKSGSNPQIYCIGQSAAFGVEMQGSGPWKLNYELIHAGKRTKFVDENITKSQHMIQTEKLINGGEYTLALTTVEDVHGCKIFLKSEARIDVRRQRPKASFGEIEGQTLVKALQGDVVRIPVRLSGETPFSVKVKHYNAANIEKTMDIRFNKNNDFMEAREEGRYEIIQIHDAHCPGSGGESPNIFDVEWIARPSLSLQDTAAIRKQDNKFVRDSVCEGDEDATEILFSGKPPFKVNYEQAFHGKRLDQRSIHAHELKAGVNVANIRMDTSKAGLYQYKFLSIADGLYNSHKLRSDLVLEQTVHSRPSAKFQHPGKTYKYCLEAGTGDDVIPINLEGTAPFILDIRIKHYATGKSENVHIARIETHLYHFRVPAYALTLGSHAISIAKVKDARSCASTASIENPHVVVAVADLPSINALDNKPYYCVGDRITYSLAGVPPFTIEYQFNGKSQKATTPATFQRIAERPGNLTITGIKDAASECKVTVDENKMIYAIPSVRVSEGNQIVEGIHEGDQAEINFTFSGTPPFTFTYTRSELARKGTKAKILEMHTQTTESYIHTILASLEGTYEVISIQDRHCGFSSRGPSDDSNKLIKMG